MYMPIKVEKETGREEEGGCSADMMFKGGKGREKGRRCVRVVERGEREE